MRAQLHPWACAHMFTTSHVGHIQSGPLPSRSRRSRTSCERSPERHSCWSFDTTTNFRWWTGFAVAVNLSAWLTIANNAKINCIFRALIRSSIFCDCRFIDTPYTCSEQREPKVKLRFPRRCPWKGSKQSLPWGWERARSFQSSIQIVQGDCAEFSAEICNSSQERFRLESSRSLF